MVNSVEKVIENARKAFGYPEGRSDTECLVLRILQLERFKDGRLELMNLNSAQASKIARLENKVEW